MLASLLIALPMIVCGIFTLELLFSWLRGKDVSQGCLAMWALAATLLYGGHFFYFHHVIDWLPLSDTIYVACNLAVFPLYLVYISALTDRYPLVRQPSRLVILLGPSVLFALVVGVLYMSMSEQETSAFIRDYLYLGSLQGLSGISFAQGVVHSTAHILFAIYVIGVLTAGIRKIRKYNQQLKYIYVDTDDKQLRHITVILWLLVATSLLSTLVNAVGREHFGSILQLSISSLMFSALLFSIGWSGLQTSSFAKEIYRNEDGLLASQDEAAETVGADFNLLAKQFELLMNNDQLYLKHDVRLDSIAQLLGTNRTYLLSALKQKMGTTFNEYVNRKRITYARQLMSENPSMLKSEVAARAGYNSLSAFYRNLKNFNG